ncbi:hypothetical protein V6N13_102221 [Hibiscus sabdariffa]
MTKKTWGAIAGHGRAGHAQAGHRSASRASATLRLSSSVAFPPSSLSAAASPSPQVLDLGFLFLMFQSKLSKCFNLPQGVISLWLAC